MAIPAPGPEEDKKEEADNKGEDEGNLVRRRKRRTRVMRRRGDLRGVQRKLPGWDTDLLRFRMPSGYFPRYLRRSKSVPK